MTTEQAIDSAKGCLESYLRGKGINTRKKFTCQNPKHTDKHPSMSYDRNRRRAHCFSCGASYDIFDLIGMDYGLSEFKDQLAKACELYGIEIDRSTNRPESKPAALPDQTAPTESETLANKGGYMDYYYQCRKALHNTNYLQERGISKETAVKYWLGYDAEYKTFNNNEDGSKSPATWRGLIIPTSENSYVVRNTDTPQEPQKKNRYRKKGSVSLFNLKALKKAEKPIFVVEGELDALSIIEAGGEALGLGATSNYMKLANKVKEDRPTQPLILALDADQRGQETEEKLAQELEAIQIPFYRHNPYGAAKDANEALLKDREQLQKEIAKAETIAAEMATNTPEEAPEEEIKPVSDYAELFKQHREEFKQNIRTGYTALDIALGGGFGNELYIMGAETSTGKSAIASVLAQNMARAGVNVLYYALEMGRDEFIARGASSISVEHGLDNAIKYGEILNDTYDPATNDFYRRPYSQYAGYVQEYFERYGKHLYIIEGGINGRTAKSIADAAAKFKEDHPGEKLAVFIDYLQLLAADPEDKTQRDFMGIMSAAVKTLKALASQGDGMTVFVISSMANDRKGKAVNDASFKYSGDIGYTGGVLLGWNWEGVTNSKDEKKREEVIKECKLSGYREMTLEVMKHRNNDKYTPVKLIYRPAYNYIEEDK